jgi:predicted dinucleotide-binding enzyme
VNRSSKGETMNIGLIGPGEIGSVIVRKLRDAGYPVKTANSKGPDSLRKLAAETGAKPVSVEEVVQDVDVLFIVLPQKAIPELPKGLLNKAKKETIVIDVGNYYPFRDDRIDEIDNGLTDSAWVEKQIGRPVIKVLNSIVSNALAEAGRPAGSRDRVALPISGDNPKAKEIVAQIIDRFGFDSVDAGTIAESWRQQPGSPVYCVNPTKGELQKWLKNVDRSSLGTKREEGMKAHFAVEQRDPRTGALIKKTDYQTLVNAHRSVHPEIVNSK